MKNAIIVHGMPSKEKYYDSNAANQSDSHWISWLQHQLMVNDIYAAAPEMPLSFKPDYQLWKREFERYDITPETILVGHSCGAGFLVRWLSENQDVRVGNIILVAPWMNVEHEEDIDFFEGFSIDPNITRRVGKIAIFHSIDDSIEIQNTVRKLKEEIPSIGYKKFKNHGHFTRNSMGTDEFPELLKEILK